MTGEQWGAALALTVITLALVSMVVAIIADARAEKSHRLWEQRWREWMIGGMKGPMP